MDRVVTAARTVVREVSTINHMLVMECLLRPLMITLLLPQPVVLLKARYMVEIARSAEASATMVVLPLVSLLPHSRWAVVVPLECMMHLVVTPPTKVRVKANIMVSNQTSLVLLMS